MVWVVSQYGDYGISAGIARSVRLRAGEFDHLGPLLCFPGKKLGKITRRAGHRRATEVGNARLHPGIGEGGVERLIEPLDNRWRRPQWCGDAVPGGRLIARQEFRHGWQFGHDLGTRCRGYRERTQLA